MVILCFHCGEPGHRVANCPAHSSKLPESNNGDTKHSPPFPGSLQSLAGREAFKCYIGTRDTIARERDVCETKGVQKKGPHYFLTRVRTWMEDAEQCQRSNSSDNRATKDGAQDPLTVLHVISEAEQSGSVRKNQRWHDLHRAKYNDLDKAQRESFNAILNDVRYRLAHRLDVSDSDVDKSTWRAELSRAVKLGRPAIFSHGDGVDTLKDNKEMECNNNRRHLNVYCVEKLQARCRQLHHLLFYDDSFAAKIRSKFLLPVPNKNISGIEFEDEPVNVISIGGGPGYDHIAICLAAKFLFDAQPRRTTLGMRSIKTQIFDLFDKDWASGMMALRECFLEGLFADDHCDEETNIYHSFAKNLSMNHADIRLRLDEPSNAGLSQAISSVNIICAQFVLHENASFLLTKSVGIEQQSERIGGALVDIFNRAKLGTIFICTDSNNTLFPALKATAKEHGWIYIGDEEQKAKKKKLTYLGPKSFVMLERTKLLCPQS